MPKTVAERLAQVHAGQHITADSLEALKKDLGLIMAGLRDKMDDLEAADQLIGEHVEVLCDPDGSREDRADAWVAMPDAAYEALAALKAFEAWRLP